MVWQLTPGLFLGRRLASQLYTLCTYEPKKSFKGLENITVEDEEVEAGAEA